MSFKHFNHANVAPFLVYYIANVRSAIEKRTFAKISLNDRFGSILALQLTGFRPLLQSKHLFETTNHWDMAERLPPGVSKPGFD